jgi:hypothetical protein
MYTALRATSSTLKSFIQQALITDPILGAHFNIAIGGNMIVSLNSPQELTANSKEGLSVWLYQVERDPERLNAPAERISYNELRRQPLPVRLHYLITPIINPGEPDKSPETEQEILGKVLQVLNDHPTLRGADLKDEFTGSSIELQVRLEPLSLEETSRLFYALERSFQLAVSYEVSVVLIESARQPMDRTPVEELITEYGVIVG